MKALLTTALVLGFATHGFADIQDPPSNDYGPTRKLGRGLSNLVFGLACRQRSRKSMSARATPPPQATASSGVWAAAMCVSTPDYSNF